MVIKAEESNGGLVTTMLSSTIQGICEQVHSSFRIRNGLKMWMLTVVGLQQPAVSATSNPPDGFEGNTKQITLTLEFAGDLMQFLDEQHDAWLSRKSN